MSNKYETEEKRVQDAIDYKNRHPGLSLKTCADEFDAPYKRVVARHKGVQSKMQRPGSNKKLNSMQEQMLLAYIERMDRIGTYALIHQVHAAAERILVLHAQPGTEPASLGRDWTKNFVKRHKETLYKVRQKPIEVERAASNDSNEIAEWYTSYKDIKAKYGILPCDEYNFDESGFRIGIGGAQWIITRVSDNKRLHSASETNRDFASVLEAISGDGVALDPAVIIKGAQIMHQHLNNTDIPDGYMLGAQTRGYLNDDLAFEWIQHFDK